MAFSELARSGLARFNVIGGNSVFHYNDVTWASWRLESPFVQQLVQANNKGIVNEFHLQRTRKVVKVPVPWHHQALWRNLYVMINGMQILKLIIRWIIAHIVILLVSFLKNAAHFSRSLESCISVALTISINLFITALKDTKKSYTKLHAWNLILITIL